MVSAHTPTRCGNWSLVTSSSWLFLISLIACYILTEYFWNLIMDTFDFFRFVLWCSLSIIALFLKHDAFREMITAHTLCHNITCNFITSNLSLHSRRQNESYMHITLQKAPLYATNVLLLTKKVSRYIFTVHSTQ